MLTIIYHHRTQMDDAQGIHITKMIEAFKQLGHKVHSLSLVNKNEKQTKERGKFWEISKFTPAILYEIMEILYNFYGYFKLKKVIKLYKPDFIYERYASFNFCGVLAAKHTNTKIVLEVNAPLHKEKITYSKLFFKKISKHIENWVCNNATKTIVVTSVLKDILLDQGVLSDQLHVMSNGIDINQFNKPIKNNIRRKYLIPEKAIVIGVIAWFQKMVWYGSTNKAV